MRLSEISYLNAVFVLKGLASILANNHTIIVYLATLNKVNNNNKREHVIISTDLTEY